MEKTVEQAEYFIERGNLSDLISIRLRLIDFKRYFADFMDEECLDENTARQIVAGAEKRMAGKSVQSVSVRNGRHEFPCFRETGRIYLRIISWKGCGISMK